MRSNIYLGFVAAQTVVALVLIALGEGRIGGWLLGLAALLALSWAYDRRGPRQSATHGLALWATGAVVLLGAAIAMTVGLISVNTRQVVAADIAAVGASLGAWAIYRHVPGGAKR